MTAHRLERRRRGARPDPAHFTDAAGRLGAGVFFDTADDAEALLHRPREITDNATPSGAAALAGALLTASALAGRPAAVPRRPPRRRCGRRARLARRFPRFAGHWLTVAEARRGARCRSRWSAPTRSGTRWPAHARASPPAARSSWPGAPDAPGRAAARPPAAGRRRRRGLRLPRLRLRPPRHDRRRAHRRPPASPRRPRRDVAARSPCASRPRSRWRESARWRRESSRSSARVVTFVTARRWSKCRFARRTCRLACSPGANQGWVAAALLRCNLVIGRAEEAAMNGTDARAVARAGRTWSGADRGGEAGSRPICRPTTGRRGVALGAAAGRLVRRCARGHGRPRRDRDRR